MEELDKFLFLGILLPDEEPPQPVVQP